MKILITGVTGFVGSHLAEFLIGKGLTVYGTYRWRSRMENIKHIEDLNLVNCELLDAHSVYACIEKIKPDIIFHLAAQSYVPASFNEPTNTIETNIIGTLNILEAVRRIKEQPLIKNMQSDPLIVICSSSEVYGQVKESEIPIKETNEFRPASPYGVSKVGEDLIAYQYWLSYGLKIVRTRMFTHTGPRRGDVFVESAFAKQIARIEKGIQARRMKVGNIKSIRTFADVRDMVKAYWMIALKTIETGKYGEVYNIGGNVTMSIKQMLEELLKMTDKKIEVIVDPSLLRPSDVTLQIPDTSKFERFTGWKPEIPFTQTLKDILDYWRERV